jgi:16S rRNA (adenine1518-N6/adenine1519-N6)-dimethyltransferase
MMTKLDNLPPVRTVIERHELAARKSMGQNFLTDLNITDRIARSANPLAQSTVIEIGPGPGTLSRSILAAEAAKLVVIEKDQRFLAALEEINQASDQRMSIHHGDALSTDLSTLVGGPYKIIANLPYNVATPLVIGWLSQDWPSSWQSMTLMFQKEVAQRLCASEGSKSYGRLSVLAQSRSVVRRLFDLPPQAFSPPPKVTSTVVQFLPLAQAPAVPVDMLEKVTGAAFGQRRKMLRQSLKSLNCDALALLDAAGLQPTLRAENLTVAEFERLTRAYMDIRGE